MRKNQGFTLVEAAVAIGVVAILSGIIIPLVLKNIRDAQMARARNDLQVIAGAVASQFKDTGRRPQAGNGPGGADGSGENLWASKGDAPGVPGAANAQGAVPINPVQVPGANTFENLFCAPAGNPANALFGFPNGHHETGEAVAYRGPYLGKDMAGKTDPWGRKYLIVGYNANGQAGESPIWVVCAGPSGQILGANLAANNGVYPETWTYTGVSEQNIAIRIN